MSTLARALRTIRKHRMFPRGARVLVALSGGADSVALLHILRELAARGELVLAGVAHLNHLLRHEESEADEQFCRELAGGVPLPFDAARVDVAARARVWGCSLESAARTARYAFLNDAAVRLGADVVAIGHTLDDQAETVVLRLSRGAGPRGLAGIRPRAGRIVRPLLEISRAELRGYLASHDLAYREDSSNADVSIPRNRVRHEVLPHLEQFAPGICRILAREAALARADEEYLSSRAAEVLPSVVSRTEGGVELAVAALASLPAALGSRVVRRVLEQSSPGRFISAAHIGAVLELVHARDGSCVVLPGTVARRHRDRIVFGETTARPFREGACLALSVPGEVRLGQWTVSAARGIAPVELPPARGGLALIAADALRLPLAVRTRRRGDRFQPLGMGGRQRKLQDFLVDRKVARAERDGLPLVVDRDDRIVWVAGQSLAEDFRVTAASRAVILLTVRRLGGPG